MIRFKDITVDKKGQQIAVNYTDEGGKKNSNVVDMVILTPAIIPNGDSSKIADVFGISIDNFGFFKEVDPIVSSVVTSKPGVYVAGCSQGPKNIQDSVSQANAAVGKILSSVYGES